MHSDWVVAFATIIGALIGAVGLAVIEYVRKERKILRFVIEAPEDLAAALRSHSSSFELKIDEVSTKTLTAVAVSVQNIGNVVIRDVTFDISITGAHRLAQARVSSENAKIAAATTVQPRANNIFGREYEPSFTIATPYLNPGDSFKVTAFYDGQSDNREISCHLPGVHIKKFTSDELVRKDIAVQKFTELLSHAFGVGTATAILGVIATAIAALFSAH